MHGVCLLFWHGMSTCYGGSAVAHKRSSVPRHTWTVNNNTKEVGCLLIPRKLLMRAVCKQSHRQQSSGGNMRRRNKPSETWMSWCLTARSSVASLWCIWANRGSNKCSRSRVQLLFARGDGLVHCIKFVFIRDSKLFS
jgi:hypothetical protein